jgi:hypothetical protein
MSNRENLAALLGHLNRHPHLDDTFSGANSSRDDLVVQLYPYEHNDDHLGVFAQWARTLADAGTVRVQSVGKDGTPHLYLTGRLADGTPATVISLPNADQTDLLAANLPLVKGAEFDVDLLLRLTDHTDAEQVPA